MVSFPPELSSHGRGMAAVQVVRLRQKIAGMASSIKNLFGADQKAQDQAVVKLEALKARVVEVR